MSILGYIIIALAKVAGLIINLYTIIVIVAALISWFSPDPYNPIVRIIYGLTHPVFRVVRRFMPMAFLRLPIDISPIVVLLVLVLFETFAVGALYSVGTGMLQ